MGEALFYAFFVGIGFGIYYDILRLFRLTAGLDLFFHLLFWVSCSFVTFSYLLIFNNGEIRWIYLVTILVGFLAYILSFGKLFLPIQKTIAKKVKIRLKKFKKVFPEMKNVYAINNIIDYKNIIKKSQESVKEEINKNNTIFLNVGRHDEEQKKLSRIIEACNKLKKEGLKFKIIFVGDGKNNEEYNY